MYHFNPITNRIGICKATIKLCPLLKENPENSIIHGNSKEEVKNLVEQQTKLDNNLQGKKSIYSSSFLNYRIYKDTGDSFKYYVDDNDKKSLTARSIYVVLEELSKNFKGSENQEVRDKIYALEESYAHSFYNTENGKIVIDSDTNRYFLGMRDLIKRENTNSISVGDFQDEIEKIKKDFSNEDTIGIIKYSEDSNDWLSKLDKDELNAIGAWTSGGSKLGVMDSGGIPIPRELRAKDVKKYNEVVEQALSKAVKDESRPVYRGLSLDNIGYLKKDNNSMSNKDILEKFYPVGETITLDKHSSSSVEYGVADSFSGGIILEFNTKKGGEVGNISSWGLSEMEVLLPKNSEFKVRGYRVEYNGFYENIIVELEDYQDNK